MLTDAGRVLARAVREPLVQFMAIAVVLFTANQLIHGSNVQVSSELITISQGRVQQLAESYRLLSGRMPSRAELQALVNDFADEEIAYREAIAMGLDADDTIVRRRMRQKLEFLAEDADASQEPTDEQLSSWLAAHATDYRLPARVSFRQVMASADAAALLEQLPERDSFHRARASAATRGERAKVDAMVLLEQLRGGADPTKLGDPSMLPSALPPTTQQGVAMLFGETFAATVFAHAEKGWFGPVLSPLGSHAVLILSREPARNPVLADIRAKLRSDWIESRRREQREQFLARLRKRYEVAVEWPEIYAAQSAPADVPKLRRPLDSIDTSGE